MSEYSLSSILEAVLLAAGRPVTVEQILELFEETQRPTAEEVKAALAELGPDMLTTRGLKVFDAAMAGLFNGFVVITGISLAVLGLVLLLAGGVLPAIAVATFVVGAADAHACSAVAARICCASH